MNDEMNEINDFLENKKIEEITDDFGISFVMLDQTTKNLTKDNKLKFYNALENEIKYPRLFDLHKNNFDFFDLENVIDLNSHLLIYINKSENILNKFQNINKKDDRLIIKNLLNNNLIKNDHIYNCYDKYLLHKQLFDQTNNFTEQLADFLIDNNEITPMQKVTTFYTFNDFVDKKIILSKVNKLIRSIVSNKYKHLINEESQELFLNALNVDYLVDNIKNNLGSKLAAIKTSEQFNLYLSDTLGFDVSWDKTSIINKIERSNCEVLTIQDNKIFFDVNTYSQTSSLGSQQWCLTRSKSQLSTYAYEENERLVFVYDTNKDAIDPFSKVALLYKNGLLVELYDKNDKLHSIGNDLFNEYKTINLPNISNKTVKERFDYYKENLLTDNENSIDFNKNVSINLLKLKAFKKRTI